MLRVLVLLPILMMFALPTMGHEFDPARDGFSFANETVLAYGVDEAGRLHMGTREEPAAFAHRCICMVRGVMQFWKFARFEPKQQKLSSDEYRRRLRKVFRIPVWARDRKAERRIVFPGYSDLWSFSEAHRHLVQEEIGAWLPTYVRVGNWRMPCPATRFVQGVTARALNRTIPAQPQALYLAKFPSMNHAVLAYSVEPRPGGGTRYRVYDPNYPGTSARLDYLPERRLFDFERRFYWPGGEVRAFRIYLSPFH